MILIVEFPTVQLLAFQIPILEDLVFVEDQLKFVTTLFVLNFKNRCNRKDRKILLFFLYKYLISNGIKLLASLYHICSLFFIKLQLYTCNFSNKWYQSHSWSYRTCVLRENQESSRHNPFETTLENGNQQHLFVSSSNLCGRKLSNLVRKDANVPGSI